MELRLQPKPEIEIPPANQGIVSKKEFFVKKVFEEINQYFFAGHLIRRWKPKAELIYPPVSDELAIQYECDFNRDIQNCFVEDYAEEVFLRTPPPCFVVLGKFGTNVRKLSQDIANEYGSVLIEVDNIVSQVIRTESETAKFLDRVLRLGVSLTLNFILALLSYVAHSPEARHRGYVLCGLPCLPQMHDLSVEQQLNYLFAWENKPTVFINVLFEDDELIKARSNVRYKIEGEGKNKYISIRCQLDESGDNEEVEAAEEEQYKDFIFVREEKKEEEEDVAYEPNIDIVPSQPCVKLPRDGENQVWSELELFDIQIKPFIDLTTSRIDPQYFMTVDSRVENTFEIVQARLSLLKIWKIPVVVPFIPYKHRAIIDEKRIESEVEEETENIEKHESKEIDDEEVDPDILRIIDEPPQSAFLTLFAKKTISPKFRWELSHYNYTCPVSLRSGEIVEGKSRFAVTFMKYIYFLRDEECLVKFMKNPRWYVLPVRPKPPCRFFIIGYPHCGKTLLAQSLANEYSIAFIDLNVVLKHDAARKKNIYKEFCRQKAEAREITRLTVQSWREWRLEEEQRVILIEKWISYIQTLLAQRIEQFYSLTTKDTGFKGAQTQVFSGAGNADRSVAEERDKALQNDDTGRNKKRKSQRLDPENLEIHGVSAPSSSHRVGYATDTASEEIKHAVNKEDYNFDQTDVEVEANSYVSSLWKSFSEYKKRSKDQQKELNDEEDEIKSIDDESIDEDELNGSDTSINWTSLLPPQSLSSLMLNKKLHTIRERRKSFKMLLSAASKVHWGSSPLRAEFAKWRLPCFMDIPLCEIFLDNPFLLYKYCPEWLKERPLIPDPIDPNYPSVTEAGHKAFNTADCVTIKQDKEEVGILLRDTIIKAEKDGMRISGETFSPGGWVVDNMVLDLQVWSYLIQEGVFADHVYILIDNDPELKRILNMWCGWNGPLTPSIELSFSGEEYTNFSYLKTNSQSVSTETATVDEKSVGEKNRNTTSGSTLWEEIFISIMNELELEESQNKELDKIFEILKNNETNTSKFDSSLSLDFFTQALFQQSAEHLNAGLLRENSSSEENTLDIYMYNNSSSSVCLGRKNSVSYSLLPLGTQLQVFTEKLANILTEVKETQYEETLSSKKSLKSLNFLVSLLSLPKKLEEIKTYLGLANRFHTIKEVIVNDKTTADIFSDILEDLSAPFKKKPRELESFEIDEIKREFETSETPLGQLRPLKQGNQEDEEEEEIEIGTENYNDNNTDEREDVRIYGESGPFCIVNLERNILFKGKPEFVLRYYGKLYFFWDENAKAKFIADPEKYAPYYSPIRCLPPVRIFIVGAAGCGKTSIARPLSVQFGFPQVQYIKLLGQNLVPHITSKLERDAIFNEKKLLLMEKHNDAAQRAKKDFMNAPVEDRKFWLENHRIWYDENSALKRTLEALKEPSIMLDLGEVKYKRIDDRMTQNSDDEDSLDDVEFESSVLPFESMDEIESKLYQYVQNKSDLDENYVLKCIKVLWTQEPYIRHGFILERFPLRSSDVEEIIENNFIPDLILEVSLPEQDMIARNIDHYLEIREAKLNHEIEEEKNLESTLQSLNDVLVSVRRKNLIAEKRDGVTKSKLENKLSGSSSNLKEEEKIPAQAHTQLDENGDQEIEDVLKEEFPDLVFNPIFESYESGKERLETDLTQNYQRDLKEIGKIKEIFERLSVPWMVIDNKQDLNRNLNEIFIKVNELKKRANQKGEFAFVMKMKTAEQLLQQGYYFLSKFGRWCPVQVFRMKNPIHMFEPLKKKGKIFPVAYRNYIYFVGGENETTKFLNDPIKYTFNQPHHPNIPLRIAVIGPPKSGKSTLCKRLQHMFDLKVVTMGTALRFVTEKMPNTLLKKSIEDYLRRGCFIPLSLKIEALTACLNDPTCVSQGFVFDGIPFDAAMTQSLAERGKLPFVILSLVGDAYSGKSNRQDVRLKDFRLPYKQRVNLDTKYKEWNETYKRFSQWNQETYNNLYELKAKSNVADIFYKAYDIIRKSFFAILYYVENCVCDKALPLEHLCVSLNEYELRKSSFHNNCPVCWVESNVLNCSSDPPSRSGLVQYLTHFYWICPNHMKKFLKTPKAYIPPRAPSWPKSLPKVLNKTMFESASPKLEIHGLGRCPVTRVDFPSRLDWGGSWDYAASYNGKAYLCKNKEMLTRFLATPWRYCSADTQFEIGPEEKSSTIQELGPPIVTSLPPIGFLEQTVASLIQDALKVLGAVRPLYPNLTPACTGCTFVALYLKAYNKTRKISLEMEYLNYMIRECRASRFLIGSFEREQGTFQISALTAEPSEEEESESSEDSISIEESQHSMEQDLMSADSSWAELKTKTEENMWSAEQHSTKRFEMILTSDDELQEIKDHPHADVILRYDPDVMRSNPLPPITNVITYIYKRKQNLKLVDKFNYNSLYAPVSTSNYDNITFNPEKPFFHQLYHEDKPERDSAQEFKMEKRTISIHSYDETKWEFDKKDPDTKALLKVFVPRFQILDTLVVGKDTPPPLPTVVTEKPLIFDPHRDYTYTLLLADFFHCSHILRTYAWDEDITQTEYGYLVDKTLELTPVESVFFRKPHISPSMISRRSTDSYMELLDVNATFKFRDNYSTEGKLERTASLYAFMEAILMESLEKAFSSSVEIDISYTSFDSVVIPTRSSSIHMKPLIQVQRTLPYPPLVWDTISSPYYSYRMIFQMFSPPRLDEITHARRFSILDGVVDFNERIIFLRDPGKKKEDEKILRPVKDTISQETRKQRYFVYDFFHLPWTSFFTYPYSWAINKGIRDNFVEHDDSTQSQEEIENTSV